jgi:hypothetical protein
MLKKKRGDRAGDFQPTERLCNGRLHGKTLEDLPQPIDEPGFYG